VTTAYAGAVPADLLLVCGVYGNVPDADIRATIDALPSMAAPGATTIWTRSRRDPDLTPTVRRWYREAGFEELAFEPIADSLMSVGAWRFTGEPRPFRSDVRLFSFAPEKQAGPAGGVAPGAS
jgi:hypothetical protein